MNMPIMKLMIAVFAVMAIGGYILHRNPRDLNYQSIPAYGQMHRLQAEGECDPQQAWCWFAGPEPGLSFAVHFEQPPQVLKPFNVKLKFADGAQPHFALAEFSMLGMDMGVNRFRFQLQADGVWSSQVLLPVCTSQRNDWLMTLSVQLADDFLLAEQAFKTSQARNPIQSELP